MMNIALVPLFQANTLWMVFYHKQLLVWMVLTKTHDIIFQWNWTSWESTQVWCKSVKYFFDTHVNAVTTNTATMGQGGNGMKQDQLKQLVLLTNKKLGKKEIVSWYKKYKKITQIVTRFGINCTMKVPPINRDLKNISKSQCQKCPRIPIWITCSEQWIEIRMACM